MTKNRYEKALLWKVLCNLVIIFNIVFSLGLCLLKQYDYAGLTILLTVLLGILIFYQSQKEIRMQIRETLDSDIGGKVLADIVDPGYGMHKISIRKSGVIFITKNLRIWYLKYPDITVECYKKNVIIKSKELTPQVIQIKTNDLINKVLLDAGVA